MCGIELHGIVIKSITYKLHIRYFYNIQIAIEASSPRLSSTQEYPLFLRSVPPDNNITPGISGLMRHFRWEHIAIVTQEEDLFTFVSYIILYIYNQPPSSSNVYMCIDIM